MSSRCGVGVPGREQPRVAGRPGRDYDALLVLAPRVTAATLEAADRLALIARFGVGYDTVDVEPAPATACPHDHAGRRAAAGGGGRSDPSWPSRHKLLIKDRLTRAGRWADKLDHMGDRLTGRTLGMIGLGNIGRERLGLAARSRCATSPTIPTLTAERRRSRGVELVDLETLLREADFVCILCALTPETRHLLNAERLALMKPTAYLINTARGPIVDQQALTTALRDGRIAGAGLDVFEQEPVDPKTRS